MCGPASSGLLLPDRPSELQYDSPAADGSSLEQQRLLKHLRVNGAAAAVPCAAGGEDPEHISSPSVSPRSACSTPGRTAADACFKSPGGLMRRGLHQPVRRQFSSNDRQRFSHDVQRPSSFSTTYGSNPWGAAGSHQGATSTYSSSSPCSIVRAIASLGLEGPRAGTAAALRVAGASMQPRAAAAFSSRGSISKAKKILAEAISSVPGAHGLASYATSAADTGVLSPLLTIIRNNGVVKGTAEGSRSGSRVVSRRSSFNEAAHWRSSSLYSLGSGSSGSSSSKRVQRCSSFSEAAGGLNSGDFAGAGAAAGAAGVDASSSLARRACSLDRPLPPASAGCMPLSPAQQQQKVADCLETVRYLAMDDSNRMALIDLGAVELLLSKLQPAAVPSGSSRGGSSSSSGGGASSSSSSHSSDSCAGVSKAAATAPAVIEGVLAALAVLAKHDATKLRVWDNPQSAALLQMLSQRRTSPAVKAAHLCVANLAWSIDFERSCQASSGSSSVFDSVSSHPGRDCASSTTSSCGSNVLLTPLLIPALAAGLHPAADAPVLASLLALLNKAASSSCLAPSPTASPSCSDSCASSESSSEQLCAVSFSQGGHSAAWKVGWQQAIFALPPLLMRAQQGGNTSSSSSGGGCGGGGAGPQEVLRAALGVMLTLTEQHPEFHAVVCAAGCVGPMLALLLNSCSSSEYGLQAACVLSALLDCPEAVELLGQEGALALLLQVLGDSHNSVDVRLTVLHMLRRLAAASHSRVELLKLQGAVHTVVALLQQVHSSDIKRAAVGLLQLLGKQVVVRPRRSHKSSAASSTCDGGSNRNSMESDCSAASSHQQQQQHQVEAAAHSLEELVLRQQQHQQVLPTPPCYLHAH